jgi:hypothetical protein
MGEQMQPGPVDGAIAAIAGRQHGVIGYPQLKALGLSRRSTTASGMDASTASTAASTPSDTSA